MQMELRLQNLTPPLASFNHKARDCTFGVHIGSLYANKTEIRGRKTVRILSALPETAASIAVTATIVGLAATLLARRTKSSQVNEEPTKSCENCGGSGICPECKGEGFVLKRMSEQNAERARLMAKDMATRYTAGLPKKWSYCTKCSSSRSCNTCGGTGKLSYTN
ncbi:hypothetical protein ABFX02_14G244800 [Erythranthe guttata]